MLLTTSLLASSESYGTEISLEHATTAEEIQWGLMARETLPDNTGMLFSFKKKQIQTMWSFGCLFDISVAFLDDKGTITEIHTLRAFPEKMDPSRPVNTLQDLKKYYYNDPIVVFFNKNNISSHKKTRYALEVMSGWFDDNNITVGDKLLWEKKSPQGVIISEH